MHTEMSEEIAEYALREALLARAYPGTWRGVARGVAWRLVSTDNRDPRQIEQLSESAETILASLIEDGLWMVEQTARRAFAEYLGSRPADEAGAFAAARLDAAEKSSELVTSACDRVYERLRGSTERAA